MLDKLKLWYKKNEQKDVRLFRTKLGQSEGRAGHLNHGKPLFPWSASLYLIKSCKKCETDITNHQHILWVLNQSNNHSLVTPMVSRLTMRIITFLPPMSCLSIVVFYRQEEIRRDKVLWICTLQYWKFEA